MDNEEINREQQGFDERSRFLRERPQHNHWLGGFVIILVGFGLLLNRIPATAPYFPDWLFDWPMILIAVGFFAGARQGFRTGFGWLAPILIGLYFLLKDRHVIDEKWDLYALPLLLIIAGFFLIIKRNRRCYGPHNRSDMYYYERMRRKQERWQQRREFFGKFDNKQAQFTDRSNEDYVDINSVFGSAEKSMFTKTFKGGNISCSFGGGELNLSQADMEETAILNITVTFGGAEITVPANWTIQNELNAFMGGIEDKRRMSSGTVPPKILILRGNIFCGGVEIKN